MSKKVIRDLTESGDFYEGTKEAWDRYHQAWADDDMALVKAMETGEHDDFYYAP